MAERYNRFFHPNLCHVCKEFTEELIECPLCHMISYCSEDHRMMHRPQHIAMCEAIVISNFYQSVSNSPTFPTLEEWNTFNKRHLDKVKEQFDRNLEPYEKQMFLFAKSCRICRRRDNLTIGCNSCWSINLCQTHSTFNYVHCCYRLQLFVHMETKSVLGNDINERIPTSFLKLSSKYISGMQSFILIGLQRTTDLSTWDYRSIMYSDDLSRPLTLLHGLRRANLSHIMQLSSNFVVHVIAGDFVDLHSFSAWEIVLHKLRPHTTLRIAIVGPTLQYKHRYFDICDTCKRYNKSIIYEYYPLSYHNLANMLLLQPNVIVGFNVEFNQDEMSKEIIKSLQHQKCPLILTAKSAGKASEIKQVIDYALESCVSPIVNERNDFRSFRTYRDLQFDCAFYPNEYVIVYENLSESSSDSTETNSNINLYLG